MHLRRCIRLSTDEWNQAKALVGGRAGDGPLEQARDLLHYAELMWQRGTPAYPPPGPTTPQADAAAIVATTMSELKNFARQVVENTQPQTVPAQQAPQQPPGTMTVNMEEQVALRAEKIALERELAARKDLADEMQD